MSKTAVKTKTFAEEGLEEIQSEATAIEANLPEVTVVEEDEFADESTLSQVGENFPVEVFYHFKTPKKAPKSAFYVMQAGDVVVGKYLRSFISGKFKNPTFVIKLKDTGMIIGYPSAGKLESKNSFTSRMSRVVEGATVKIIYKGMSEIKGGEWKGNEAHNIILFASAQKP